MTHRFRRGVVVASLKLIRRKPREEFVFEVFVASILPLLSSGNHSLVNTWNGHGGEVWNTERCSSEFGSHAKLLLAVVGVNVVFSKVGRIATLPGSKDSPSVVDQTGTNPRWIGLRTKQRCPKRVTELLYRYEYENINKMANFSFS